MPNENLTELLEFCYTEPRLWILKGTHKLSKILTFRTFLLLANLTSNFEYVNACIPCLKSNVSPYITSSFFQLQVVTYNSYYIYVEDGLYSF